MSPWQKLYTIWRKGEADLWITSAFNDATEMMPLLLKHRKHIMHQHAYDHTDCTVFCASCFFFLTSPHLWCYYHWAWRRHQLSRLSCMRHCSVFAITFVSLGTFCSFFRKGFRDHFHESSSHSPSCESTRMSPMRGTREAWPCLV